MKTLKRALTVFFMAGLMLAVTACMMEERDGGVIQMFGYGLEADVPPVVSIENEYLVLEFLTDTAEIIVTERRTGFEWRSTPYDARNVQDATPVARFHMQSLFLLEFENEVGAGQIFDTYRQSVQNNSFEHAIVDGGLELYFTVGNIPQVFFLPDAIYEERLLYFIDQLDTADRRQVLEAYRLFDINRLRPADDRSELLERFPTLEHQNIFVLRDAIRDFMLERIQNMLQSVGYTIYDWEYDMNYFGLETNLDTPIFNVTMRFELDQNAMVVSVPFDDINYLQEFLPVRLNLLPFFGAGHNNDEGYLFLPDGSGSLLFFDNGRHSQQVFSSNIFGWDEAVSRDVVIHDNRAAFPVFGVYRNGHTFAAIIEEGAAYAQVWAETGGMRSPYSTVSTNFRLIHGALANVAGRTDRSIQIHELGLPEGETIVVRYVFTETPGYVGMAIAYREFLQARYPWLNNRVTEPVNAMVEVIGAIEMVQTFFGMPVSRPFALTTYDEAAAMIEDFHSMGWQNLHIRMLGGHNNSIDHSVPTRLRLISQLGNRRDFDTMLNTANRFGYEFYFEGDFVHMRHNSRFNGFSLNSDAARFVTRDRVQHNGHCRVTFAAFESGVVGDILGDPIVLATPAFTIDLVNNFVDQAANIGVNNISFRTLASALGGDFNERRYVSREASMRMRSELLADLKAGGTGVWLNYGFSYGVPFANVITGMPVSDQNFAITDVSVPFYQIALHGLVHFAGRPLNLSEDYSYYLLRSIESGSSLFFSFKTQPTSELHTVSRYRRFFANEYDRWVSEADILYQNHSRNFSHLYNQLIVNHMILADDVTVTIYEDGTRVYVNMSSSTFEAEGVTVPAMRYAVVR